MDVLAASLPVLVVLQQLVFKILGEILSFIRLLMINTCPGSGCLENSDEKSKTFLCLLWIGSRCLV